MVELERIYVGGVDPPRLTVEELLNRITSDVKDKVELKDMYMSSIYCHFNATSLQSGVSALETIRKLYNNVKWKGCKIRVEAAKPHYLERLAQERADRLISPAVEEFPGREPVPIPRHLRIRRGYGEESWKVDTKPCEVSDWSTFRKMRTRLIEKQSQAKEKKIQSVKTSAWNRAVLLRFKDTEAFSSRLKHPAHLDVSDSDSESESEVSDDQSSSATEPSSVKNSVQERRKNGAYVWSDSSDAESDVYEGEEAFKIEARMDEKNKELLENDSSDERSELSGLDGNDEDEDASSSSLEHGDEKISAGDVQSNLDILAQIFPDLEERSRTRNDTRKGWTDMGQMVRYDPTQLSSEKFIVDPSVSGSATEDEEVEMKGGDDESDEKSIFGEKEENELNAGSDVEMLEQVFKETREHVSQASENFSSHTPVQQGAFSFSFQVHESNETVAKTIVQIPKTDEKDIPEPILAEAMEIDPPIEPVEPKQKRLRRGVEFPDDALDAYVKFFFTQGDGSRIMNQGVRAYRDDPQVQAAWESQRRILTQDWRRKHKYAVAQKRKRFGR